MPIQPPPPKKNHVFGVVPTNVIFISNTPKRHLVKNAFWALARWNWSYGEPGRTPFMDCRYADWRDENWRKIVLDDSSETRGRFRHVHCSACSAEQGPPQKWGPTWGPKLSYLVHGNLMIIQNYCLQMRFLCSEWFRNAFAIGTPPQPHWRSLQRSPRPLAGGEGCFSPRVELCRLSMIWQLCVWLWRQSGNKVTLGNVCSSSRPIIVFGTLGPHIFFWTGGPGLQ